jgi:hypothetical protein
MSLAREAYDDRARALIGTRFRPQGRNEQGVDCVGLVLLAFDIPVTEARRNYRLRGDHLQEIVHGLKRRFRKIQPAHEQPGDVLVMEAGPDQVHLGIRTREGFVHAHAGIGRVVETPGAPQWPVAAVFRKRRR